MLDSIDFNRLKGSGSFSRDVICGSTNCTARLRFNQTSETLSPTIGSSATYKNSFEIFVKSSVAAANIPTEYPKASLVDALETLLSSNENYSIGTISGLDVKVVGNAR